MCPRPCPHRRPLTPSTPDPYLRLGAARRHDYLQALAVRNAQVTSATTFIPSLPFLLLHPHLRGLLQYLRPSRCCTTINSSSSSHRCSHLHRRLQLQRRLTSLRDGLCAYRNTGPPLCLELGFSRFRKTISSHPSASVTHLAIVGRGGSHFYPRVAAVSCLSIVILGFSLLSTPGVFSSPSTSILQHDLLRYRRP
ncbi:hypothetical protein GALMADRAFT_1140882 [Galerina marginata CBS 339.88]|uniref:Uncharacterized protein n=1 Tax=Galerina marginata (strain CBS 339.88) TaxID=685588 RepID=A0A067SGC2_GALM3|nr:hypothetical protein GALMADRAFT_1140882 [Galerina marginata CBS 339.88]